MDSRALLVNALASLLCPFWFRFCLSCFLQFPEILNSEKIVFRPFIFHVSVSFYFHASRFSVLLLSRYTFQCPFTFTLHFSVSFYFHVTRFSVLLRMRFHSFIKILNVDNICFPSLFILLIPFSPIYSPAYTFCFIPLCADFFFYFYISTKITKKKKNTKKLKIKKVKQCY